MTSINIPDEYFDQYTDAAGKWHKWAPRLSKSAAYGIVDKLLEAETTHGAAADFRGLMRDERQSLQVFLKSADAKDECVVAYRVSCAAAVARSWGVTLA